MMRLIFDSDGLIKLNRAGVLGRVIQSFVCLVPQSVYDEVVIEGKARRYPDAEVIEVALDGGAEVVPHAGRREPNLGLGAGEISILSLLPQMPEAIIISDDRRFLTILSAEQVPFLTPVDLLVVMAKQGFLTEDEAREALERLRPSIRTKAYLEAQTDLGLEGGVS